MKRASLAAIAPRRTWAPAVAWALVACGGAGPSPDKGAAGLDVGGPAAPATPPPSSPDAGVASLAAGRASHVWDVKLKREAIVLEGDAARALVSWEPGGEARFDATVLTDPTLVAPGRAVLVAGRALFRSKAVRTEGETLVVETEPATLADVVESGTVSWDLQLPIERAHLAAVDPSSDWRLATTREVHADELASTPSRDRVPSWRRVATSAAGLSRALLASGDEPKGPEFEAEVTAWPPVWKLSVKPMSYAVKVEPKGSDAVDLTVVVTREQGLKSSIAYKGKGSFTNLRSRTGAYYAGGKLVRMTYEQPGLTGDVEVSIAATGNDDMGDFKWQLPGMFKFAYLAGPIPVVAELGLDLTGSVKVPTTASATASTTVRFSSSKGIEWRGVSAEVAGEMAGAGLGGRAEAGRAEGGWLEPTGSMDRLDLAPKPADSAATIGVPVDAQFGVGFPKVSVSVFGQGLVPYFRPGAIIGSSLSWGPLCKRGYVKFLVGAGVDLKVLGHAHKLYEKTLHESEKRAQGEGCPPP